MIVEDEFIIADRLEDLLTSNGYQVLPVTDNYNDSVDQLNKELPDLALLDINIKGDKDGIELADYIYKHFNIPVIFLSAYSDPETVLRAKAAHPNTYILKSKPILKATELIEAIQQQLMISIKVALPDLTERNKIKTLGIFHKVKEIDTSRRREIDKDEDPVDKEMFLRFDEINFIESNNQFEKNTVLIHSNQKDKAFVLRGTMKEVEVMLPEHFVRLHDSYIVNLHKITARRLPHKLFIDNDHFNIGDKYKESVIEKITRLIG